MWVDVMLRVFLVHVVGCFTTGTTHWVASETQIRVVQGAMPPFSVGVPTARVATVTVVGTGPNAHFTPVLGARGAGGGWLVGGGGWWWVIVEEEEVVKM